MEVEREVLLSDDGRDGQDSVTTLTEGQLMWLISACGGQLEPHCQADLDNKRLLVRDGLIFPTSTASLSNNE